MNFNNKDELIESNIFQTCTNHFRAHKNTAIEVIYLATCYISCNDIGYNQDHSKEICRRITYRLCQEKYSEKDGDKNKVCNSYLGK